MIKSASSVPDHSQFSGGDLVGMQNRSLSHMLQAEECVSSLSVGIGDKS